jgi:hypothetical protein
VVSLLGACHVPPAAIGHEPVVPAGHQFGPVRECDPIRGFDHRPLVEHPRGHIPSVVPVEYRPVDSVSNPQISEWLRAPVSHQDRGITMLAVGAGMGTSPIHVDGPFERHAAGGGDPVEDGLGFDLVEGDVAELGAVEGTHRRRGVEQGQVGRGPALSSQVGEGLHPPTLERVFG